MFGFCLASAGYCMNRLGWSNYFKIIAAVMTFILGPITGSTFTSPAFLSHPLVLYVSFNMCFPPKKSTFPFAKLKANETQDFFYKLDNFLPISSNFHSETKYRVFFKFKVHFFQTLIEFLGIGHFQGKFCKCNQPIMS